jgi:hypothetical protein
MSHPFFADFFHGKLGHNSFGISPFTEAEEENSVVFGERHGLPNEEKFRMMRSC